MWETLKIMSSTKLCSPHSYKDIDSTGLWCCMLPIIPAQNVASLLECSHSIPQPTAESSGNPSTLRPNSHTLASVLVFSPLSFFKPLKFTERQQEMTLGTCPWSPWDTSKGWMGKKYPILQDIWLLTHWMSLKPTESHPSQRPALAWFGWRERMGKRS